MKSDDANKFPLLELETVKTNVSFEFETNRDKSSALDHQEREPLTIKNAFAIEIKLLSLNTLFFFTHLTIFSICFMIDFTSDHSWSCILVNAGAVFPPKIIAKGEIHRFLFAIGLHSGTFHYLANTFSYLLMLNFLERKYGRVNLLFIFLIGAFQAGMLSCFNPFYLVGTASTAIPLSACLLMMGEALLARREGVREIKSVLGLLALIFCINASFLWNSADGSFNINFLIGTIHSSITAFCFQHSSRLFVRGVILVQLLAFNACTICFLFFGDLIPDFAQSLSC